MDDTDKVMPLPCRNKPGGCLVKGGCQDICYLDECEAEEAEGAGQFFDADTQERERQYRRGGWR